MKRELNRRRTGWGAIAAQLLVLGGVLLMGWPGAARAATFYVYSTNEPGKVDAINTNTVAGIPLVPIVPSPTTKLMDIAIDSTGLLWGIRDTVGGNPAAIFTISGGVSTFVAFVTGNGLDLAANQPNALAFNGSDILYTASSNTNDIYTVNTTTGATTLVGTGAGYNGTGNNFASFGHNAATVTTTTEGDLVFAPDGTLYSIIHLNDGGGGGPANNYTYLATVNTTSGAATLIGRTTVGGIGVSTLDIEIDGLALGPGNTLYGTVGNDVYQINTTNGALTLKYTISGLGSVGAAGIVPEPAGLTVLGSGLAALWAVRRRRRATA